MSAQVKVENAIPTEVHGFRVEIGIGPYPPDSPTSHRKAIYAKLHPASELTLERMAYKGKKFILGMVPITQTAADQIHVDEELREKLARHALSVCLPDARALGTE